MTQAEKVTKARAQLRAFAVEIDKFLIRFWESELISSEKIQSQHVREVAQNLIKHAWEHNMRPAKRIRGAFIYYFYQLLNPKEDFLEKLMTAAMSIEVVHTGLLMHDDFMDQDETRRGSPTTHEYYKKHHQENNLRYDAQHFGESIAVDVGDLGLTWGYRILNEADFPLDKKVKALNYMLNGIIQTGYGQAYDMFLETSESNLEQDIIDLHRAKTGVYTYETPAVVGAVLAGASDEDLAIISKYAIPGGIAFQLQDDVLGLFGHSEKTGKPAFSDLRQGKKTLLMTYALEHANPEQKEKILKYWGNPNIGEPEAEEIRQIVRDTGSLDYSYKVASKFGAESQAALPAMRARGWNEDVIDFLDGIAEYMATKREY